MSHQAKKAEEYRGFEQGPIRPPSEANSLLIRVTRNCPWNRCTFCPVYKGKSFSLRPIDHVLRDIDMVHKYVQAIGKVSDSSGRVDRAELQRISDAVDPSETQAFHAALHWYAGGLESIFIQDANSLIVKNEDLIKILKHLKHRFPWTQRVTSYARSHTIARISDDDMKAIADAGLNRIHIGMESGADAVLKMVRKGTNKDTHIKAGQRVIRSGIQLSEYVMPGLGGKKYSEIHARESADALNRINPDFIRLRTLAIPNRLELYEDYVSGRFEKLTDIEIAHELRLFIENLDGITSTLRSDHILNLFQDLEGVFPEDKPKMLGMLNAFLGMSPHDQCLYQVGRRLGIFSSLNHMKEPLRRKRAEKACKEMNVTPENVDGFIVEMMKRFV